MIAVYHILRSDTFLFGTDGDGYPMFVGTSDEKYILFFQSQIADIDVCRYIYTGQMADMDGTVRIRQCRCDGSSFKVLFH